MPISFLTTDSVRIDLKKGNQNLKRKQEYFQFNLTKMRRNTFGRVVEKVSKKLVKKKNRLRDPCEKA